MGNQNILNIINQAIDDESTELDLSNNQLSELPREIGKLTNLTKLHLSLNKLSTLPQELGKLKKLTSLNLSFNQLSKIPLKIGELENLTELYLSNNQLTELPQEIGKLTNLTELSLSNNKLNKLPREIGKLTNLTELSLSNNKLSELPWEIGNLKNLTKLYLRGNQLSELPKEIAHEDTKLAQLDLSLNKLIKVPKEIFQLTNLTKLDLSESKLSELPQEIGKLKKLTSLNLRFNQLKELPSEICQLTNLRKLELLGNPLEKPPIEITTKGILPTFEYLRQLEEEGKDYIYEAKFLIIGEPEAGKTTLAKKVENIDYELQTREPSTEGINIIKWQFDYDQANSKQFYVNIWDFGGQEIYHATHQFFLTKRSLYGLVLDTRKEDEDVYYWLNVVELLSDNSPVIIIKNEKDDRNREINETYLKGRYENLKETLPTNLLTKRGLPELLKNIKHYITSLPHIGTALPKTWVKVRKYLEKQKRNHITLKEYFDICEENGFSLTKNKLQLSSYLHDLGVCLHFQDDPLLKKTVILKPEWGTDAVYKVLDNKDVINNQGKFNLSDLEKIWHEKKYDNMHDELLQLMIKFQLCYEIPGKKGNFIAPQLLSKSQPEYDWLSNDNLFLEYTYTFMPKGIITIFIVIMHSLIWSQNLVWRSGVILEKDQAKAEVIEYYDERSIRIRVSGTNKNELMNIVAWELDNINKSYKQLKSDKLIPCNCSICINSPKPYFFKYDDLKKRINKKVPHIECNESFEKVNIQNLLNVIVPPKDSEKKYSMNQINNRDKVFISYCHQNSDWLDKLKVYIKFLEKKGIIEYWDDTKIEPGMKWTDEINKALASAGKAVLLVSSDFLVSDFINKVELPSLLKAAEEDGATILSIILDPCDNMFSQTELNQFQTVNPPSTPLSAMNENDQKQVFNKLIGVLSK